MKKHSQAHKYYMYTSETFMLRNNYETFLNFMETTMYSTTSTLIALVHVLFFVYTTNYFKIAGTTK